jgi:hypothetical protein
LIYHERHARTCTVWGSRSRPVPLTWVLGALGRQA